ISAAGERASIGGKGQTLYVVGDPARPEQGAPLDVPQLDGTIPAPSSQRASIRAEGEGAHRVGMRLPGQVQEPPFFAPHACFPPPAAQYCPLLLMATDHVISKDSFKTVSRRLASAREASCISTPCRD